MSEERTLPGRCPLRRALGKQLLKTRVSAQHIPFGFDPQGSRGRTVRHIAQGRQLLNRSIDVADPRINHSQIRREHWPIVSIL